MKKAAIVNSLVFTEDGDEAGYKENYVVTLEGQEIRLVTIDTESPLFRELFIGTTDLLEALRTVGAITELEPQQVFKDREPVELPDEESN